MKSINLHCPCGASIQLTDATESYINPDTGKPNKDGLRYQIEARAESWLNRHQKCLDIKNQLLLKASERKPESRVARPMDSKVL
jgi:hypothetical protein